MTALTNTMSDSATTTEAPSQTLIPLLPNEVAVQCLARVPRQYHPVLSAVSKPIRALLSSPDFFAARSSLNCTEILPYLIIRDRNCQTEGLFTVYGRPKSNLNSSSDSVAGTNIIIAPVVPVPGVPVYELDWSACVAVGPKIFVMGSSSYYLFPTHIWMFDCRFHTWERGPSMPVAQRGPTKIVVLDSKIYIIGWWPKEDSWADVFDTVAGRWEAVPSPKHKVYNDMPGGFAIRDGKVCAWVKGEELRFDPATRTWEVFGSGIGWGLHSGSQLCEANGMLCCYDEWDRLIKCFDERVGKWKKLRFVNKGFRSHWRNLRMSNVGGRLVIMGSALLRNLGETMGVWCVEIEVKKGEDGDFWGEVLWSEMVCSTTLICSLYMTPVYTCTSVSL